MSAPSPTWRDLVQPAPAPEGGVALALTVDLRERVRAAAWGPSRLEPASARTARARPADVVVGLRPVMRSSASGAWVRGDVTWDALRRPGGPYVAAHARWFAELHSIAREVRTLATYSDLGEWLVLDTIESSLLWPHLATAASLGIPVVGTSRSRTVALARSARVRIRVDRTVDRGLALIPGVAIDDVAYDAAVVRPVASSGLYAIDGDGDDVALTLAPVPLDETLRALLAAGAPVGVPPGDADEFLTAYAPQLARRTVVEPGSGVDVPPEIPPFLRVQVVHHGEDVVDVSGEWRYPGQPPRPVFGDGPDRDAAFEAAVLRDVEAAWAIGADVPFASSATFTGVAAAEFATRVLPALEGLAHVRVEITGEVRRYRELSGDPRIRVTTVESADPDWFDLGVIVEIDGRRVPFTPLFRALAQRRAKMLLSDGAYFSLRHPSLDRLRELIDEGAAMAEWEAGPRLSRHQLALWSDFEDLADEAEPAVSWRAALEGLRDATAVPAVAPPAGLRATMRPYQQQGFAWLAFLAAHRLGGILADDMGLGKTLQVLALLLHRKERGERRPSLVLAPTSVLTTWREESSRFTPDLRVRVIDETGVASPAAFADVDVVVTSYTLLRLDERRFSATAWAAVILDEAQFVKNPATRIHQAAKALTADVRFALSGTPIENRLEELWALLSITSPGLFPSARRFREEYVGPIEKGRVPDNVEGGAYRARRLAQLRARLRPLVLRRTKALVAPELPERQEQVVHVELSPAHRAAYDIALQRERQKVLGLLDDLDRNRFIVFRSLTLLRLLSLSPRLIDPASSLGASKIDVLIGRLADLAAEGRRALVFSQYTSFLDLVEEAMDAAGLAHVRLDGSTTRRAETVERFRSGDASAFLISLKAGGFGLTLVEADVVFLLDPWWNPAAEAQAIDRAHRIGQTRAVMVYRLIASGTIEDKVLALQQRKSRLFRAVLDDDDLFARALTADDLRGLFAR